MCTSRRACRPCQTSTKVRRSAFVFRKDGDRPGYVCSYFFVLASLTFCILLLGQVHRNVSVRGNSFTPVATAVAIWAAQVRRATVALRTRRRAGAVPVAIDMFRRGRSGLQTPDWSLRFNRASRSRTMWCTIPTGCSSAPPWRRRRAHGEPHQLHGDQRGQQPVHGQRGQANAMPLSRAEPLLIRCCSVISVIVQPARPVRVVG